MESHIRIKVSANFVALQQLQCAEYKVLLALAGRADSVGRCYPSCAKTAEDTNLHVRTVYSAIDELIAYGYIKLLRKWFVDPISGQQMPSVYQVSPYFLEIADSFIEQALLLWGTNCESKLHINQQQNHVPEQIPLTRPQETTTTTNNRGPDEKLPTAKSEPPKNNSESHKPQGSQRSLPNQSSAIVKKYTNPLSIIAPLPDELSELLAQRINQYQISIQLARGFVHKYGYAECDKAANYFEFCRTFQDIQSPGGFYRSILEHRLADETVTAAAPDYSGGQYADFVES